MSEALNEFQKRVANQIEIARKENEALVSLFCELPQVEPLKGYSWENIESSLKRAYLLRDNDKKELVFMTMDDFFALFKSILEDSSEEEKELNAEGWYI